jgi:hypothetical protein
MDDSILYKHKAMKAEIEMGGSVEETRHAAR